jgi:hypothetical protein
VGQLVPLHPEPVPVGGENASWDAFWAEKTGAGTTVIRGVEVRVPTDITLTAQRETEQRTSGTGVNTYAPVAEQLFRNPDGTACVGLWAAWQAAGMGLTELSVVIFWGMSNAKGVPITFEEAYRLKTAPVDDEGKDEEPTEDLTKKTSRAATGGRSKPRSSRRTASTPTGSHA